jgi:hypothetical protein
MMGAVLIGCQQQDATTTGKAKAPSGSVMEQGSASAPANSNPSMAGARPGGMAGPESRTPDNNTASPLPEDKGMAPGGSTTGKAPAGETDPAKAGRS